MDLKVKTGFNVRMYFGVVAVFRDGTGSPSFLLESVKSTGMIKLISVNGLRHKTVIKGSLAEVQSKLDEILAWR